MLGVSDEHVDAIHRAYSQGGAGEAMAEFRRLFPTMPEASAARCVSFVLRWHPASAAAA